MASLLLALEMDYLNSDSCTNAYCVTADKRFIPLMPRLPYLYKRDSSSCLIGSEEPWSHSHKGLGRVWAHTGGA